jgi:hypothetical protein
MSAEDFDNLVFICAVHKEWKVEPLLGAFKKVSGITLDKKTFGYITTTPEFREKYKTYLGGGKEVVERAQALGLLNYTSLVQRLLAYESIIKKGIDGYIEEKNTPTGLVVPLTTRNLQAANTALKQVGDIMDTIAPEDETDIFTAFNEVNPESTAETETASIFFPTTSVEAEVDFG